MADGTKVYEPPSGTTIDTHEVDFGGGDVRDRQRVAIAGTGAGQDVPAKNTEPADSDYGLLTRAVGPTPGAPIVVSAGNSTSTPLGANGVFTGVTENVLEFSDISVNVAGNGAGGTIYFEFSPDGTNWDVSIPIIRGTNGLVPLPLRIVLPYFRIRYINNSTPQTSFRLTTLYHATSPGHLTRLLGQLDINDGEPVQNVRAVVASKSPSGVYLNRSFGGIEPNNSSRVNLAANASYTGSWVDTTGYDSMLVLALSDVPLTRVQVRWSADGVNVRSSLFNASSFTTNHTLIQGIHIYTLVITTMVDRFFRLEVLNGPTPNAIIFELDTWLYEGEFPGSYAGIDSALSGLSVALLTRSVEAGLTPDGLFENIRIGGAVTNSPAPDLLDPGEVYTSSWYSTKGYASIGAVINADVPSTIEGVAFEFCDVLAGAPSGVVRARQLASLTNDDVVEGSLRFKTDNRGDYTRLVYTNGVVPQGSFFVQIRLNPSQTEIPAGKLDSRLAASNIGAQVRNVQAAPNDANEYENLTLGDDGGLRVSVKEHEATTPIRPLTTLKTGQTQVGDTAAVPVPAIPAFDRATVRYTNLDPDLPIYFSESSAKLTNQADVVLPLTSIELDLDSGQLIYFKLAAQGGATLDTNLNGNATSGNVGVVSPNNLLTADDTRAVFDAITDTVDVTGFDATRSLVDVGQIKLRLEGRKTASPTTETAAFVDRVTGSAANVGSVVSGAVTANANHQYFVAISRRNAAAAINSVTGLGLVWTLVDDITGFGSVTRLSVYRGSGTPTAGTVTAVFSTPATNSIIEVVRLSGVDLTTPMDNHESLNSVSNTNTYSDSIVGTNLGLLLTFVSMRGETHAPGSGATERAEDRTGAGNNDASCAVNTLSLTATGAQAYSGTLGANTGWSVVAIAAKPQAALDPVVRVTYKVGATPGVSFLDAVLTSVADTIYEASIAADRAWIFDDVDALTLTVAGHSFGAATAEVDRVYVYVQEVAANTTALLAHSEVGGIL